MLFEHKLTKPISNRHFSFRLLKSFGIIWCIILVSLSIGICGYHYLEQIPWVDALLDASMILGGMGPVSELHSDIGKIFASCYALYSGLMLIAVTGILLAPIMHRVMHLLHYEEQEKRTRS